MLVDTPVEVETDDFEQDDVDEEATLPGTAPPVPPMPDPVAAARLRTFVCPMLAPQHVSSDEKVDGLFFSPVYSVCNASGT